MMLDTLEREEVEERETMTADVEVQGAMAADVEEPPKVELQTLDPEIKARLQQIETHFRDLAGMVVRIPALNFAEFVSAGLAAEVKGYNERRSQTLKRFRGLLDPVLGSLSRLSNPSADNPTLGDIFAAVDVVKTNRLDELQAASKVAATGGNLAKRCQPELATTAKDLDSAYNETLAEVKKDLERIGQGLDATEAGTRGHNGAAAERQFDYLAKQNVRSRKAFAETTDAQNRAQQMQAAGLACEKCEAELRRELARLAASEIRI